MTEFERQIIELLTEIRDNSRKALAFNKDANDEYNQRWQESQKAAEESNNSWTIRWMIFFALLAMVLGIALAYLIFFAVI